MQAKASRVAVVYSGDMHPERVFAPLEPRALRYTAVVSTDRWRSVVTLPRRWSKEELRECLTPRVDALLAVLMGVKRAEPQERAAFRTMDRNLRRQATERCGRVFTTADAMDPKRRVRYALEGNQFFVCLGNNNEDEDDEADGDSKVICGGELRMTLLEARTWGAHVPRAGK